MKKENFSGKIGKLIKLLPIIVVFFILLTALGMTACDSIVDMFQQSTEAETEEQTIKIPISESESLSESESVSESESESMSETETEAETVSVHIIDVGQGDAILIKTEDGNMLIDSGDLGSTPREKLISCLTAQNVTSFEYVVFTHTDADHIGSGDYVIQNYDVKTVIMPDYTASTKVYERLVDAIETKNVDLVLIGEDREFCEQVGYSFKLGPLTHTVMGPTEDFKSSNEMSVVIKSVYGETSMLFTGDAEKESEAAMLEMYTSGELKCDILKVGHHGSDTSTTDEFLAAVSPDAAMISCGEGNKYGHPKSATIDKLNRAEIDTYRTDLNGTIVITTDGVTYEITKEK